jgi:chemotaxis protein methyltransferase CheR
MSGLPALASSAIAPQDYEEFRAFLESSCGIVLGENKHYLVTSRLTRLMNEVQADSIGTLLRQLKTDTRSGLRERVIEAMTTNETYWFRDSFPFKIVADMVLPELARKGASTIRIWSAACSSGQEPYSLSMTVQEYLTTRPGSLKANVQIVGTDISPAILNDAKAARYDAMALARGLSPERKQRFFTPAGERWEVRPEIRARVAFRELNLLHSYTLLGRFDTIFCRNVLIYFSAESKRDILNRMAQSLNSGGYLILGASESLAGYSDAFEMVRCTPGVVYRRK